MEYTIKPDRSYFYNCINFEYDSDIRPFLRFFLIFLSVIWVAGGTSAIINTTEFLSLEFGRVVLFFTLGCATFYWYAIRPYIIKSRIYKLNDHSLRFHRQHTIKFYSRGLIIKDIDNESSYHSWGRIGKILKYKNKCFFLHVEQSDYLIQVPCNVFSSKTEENSFLETLQKLKG